MLNRTIYAVVLLIFLLTIQVRVAVGQPDQTTHSNQRAAFAGTDIIIRQESGVNASLRGLFVVNDQVAWTSGTGGTVLRTVNGGADWQMVSVPDQDDLDFRDVHGFDENEAIVIAAGSPAKFYRTTDGGQQWTLVYENTEARIFFDAMSFWGPKRGIAFSDPIDGRLFVMSTEDGGATWKQLPNHTQPTVRPGEAGFAASGTCLATGADGHVWIGLGGKVDAPPTSRVLFSRNYGTTWQSAETPMPSKESSGIFSLAMLDNTHGVVVGGDYLQPEQHEGNVALSDDGGRTWRAVKGTPPSGYRSAVATNRHGARSIFVAVGPTGMDYSLDLGDNWSSLHELLPEATFPDRGLHAVAFAPDGRCGWGSGSDGAIVRINVEKLVQSLTIEE